MQTIRAMQVYRHDYTVQGPKMMSTASLTPILSSPIMIETFLALSADIILRLFSIS